MYKLASQMLKVITKSARWFISSEPAAGFAQLNKLQQINVHSGEELCAGLKL